MSSFYELQPERILSATEKSGFITSGEFTQLNSYENRVFDIVLDDHDDPRLKTHLIAKFYRPGRWDQATIQEEHDFLFDLKNEGVPAIAPILVNNASLNLNEGLWLTYFPKVLGRMPEEFLGNDLEQVGRLLAQIHNIGSQKNFNHRPTMNDNYPGAWNGLDLLMDWIAPECIHRYEAAAIHILNTLFDKLDQTQLLRIHGDCHRGNLLHNGKEFFIVDFDDCMTGPAVQDFWMLLTGNAEEAKPELEQLIKGYESLREFNDHELELIPNLKGLRILSYAAWIAKRWEDPSFKRIFPDFGSYQYWAEETEALEKIAWTL